MDISFKNPIKDIDEIALINADSFIAR